ncbi:helix-turn-helix transcriptional regulator [bacterium]|nr:helix-turn-helix transcriptional regulator [bacterium]
MEDSLLSLRRSQSGKELRELRESNDLAQYDWAKMLGVAAKTVSRWEKGGVVESPGLIWKQIFELRAKGKLPRGDLDAVGVALGQLEKGPENHQSPEESPDPSQGKNSSPLAQDLSAMLAGLKNDPRLQDPAIIKFSFNLACKAAAYPPLLAEDIYASQSTRQMLESFVGCWRTMDFDQACSQNQKERQALLISMAWLLQEASRFEESLRQRERAQDPLTRFAAGVRSGTA